MNKETTSNILARLLHDFFANHLPQLRGVSPHTISSYRDSFVLLLRFLASQKNCVPAHLDLEDLSAEQIMSFLGYLEKDRHNTASTRNIRLAAIHVFFKYVSSRYPERIEQSQQVLGVPFKRSGHRCVDYLEYDELEAILSTVDRSSSDGRRDYALLAVMFNTGCRVQEFIQIRAQDLQLTKPFQIHIIGKGRKERFCPIWPQTAHLLQRFCMENRINLLSKERIFLNHRREPLTRFGVRYILAKYFRLAQSRIGTLSKKKFHPHVMRHSTAMHLLKAGVDLVTVGHWLGHASVNTTNKYVTIDLDEKRKAIEKARPKVMRGSRNWKQNPSILCWLEAL